MNSRERSSAGARARSKRRRDVLKTLMIPGAPRPATKEELFAWACENIGATRQNVDAGWVWAIEDMSRHDWYEPLPRRVGRLQVVVRAIAERRSAGVLALAKIHRLRFFCCPGHRREGRVLMRAIAEWLICGFAAGAPIVRLARFHLDWLRPLFGDYRLSAHPCPLLTRLGATLDGAQETRFLRLDLRQ